MYMYINSYTCMYTCYMYIRTCTRVQIFLMMHVHTYVHVHVYNVVTCTCVLLEYRYYTCISLYLYTYMCIYTCIYIHLYVHVCRYVDAVKPGQYGIPKPFYFPFLPSYWTGRARTVLYLYLRICNRLSRAPQCTKEREKEKKKTHTNTFPPHTTASMA